MLFVHGCQSTSCADRTCVKLCARATTFRKEILIRSSYVTLCLGKEETLNCTGFLGYYIQEDASLYWWFNDTFPKKCSGIPEADPPICEEDLKKSQ